MMASQCVMLRAPQIERRRRFEQLTSKRIWSVLVVSLRAILDGSQACQLNTRPPKAFPIGKRFGEPAEPRGAANHGNQNVPRGVIPVCSKGSRDSRA